MRIYRFSQQHCDAGNDLHFPKTVLGGKGVALVEMCGMGLPVPPGFTITTNVCNHYRASTAKGTLLQDLIEQDSGNAYESVLHCMDWLDKQFGYIPLVSVRSGAPVSMPGMMDTILNVGLTQENIDEWGKRIGVKPAKDSYRRLIQMLGTTAFGIAQDKFDFQLASVKKSAAIETDQELSNKNLDDLIKRYRAVFKANIGTDFPDTLKEQVFFAIRAVFDSWMSERAIEYRKLNKIDESMGTACTIQAMVFGNMGDDSGSGVLFSRDPSTGKNLFMAEYLVNAQGEDVVAGIRTPEKLELNTFADELSGWQLELTELCNQLEVHYKDMVDIEFTVQQHKLFILQSRVGKRSAQAAFKIAYDMVQEESITRAQALDRVTAAQFKAIRRPGIDPKFKTPPNLTGLPASPGVVTGKPVFTSKDAVNCTEPCILVSHETTPDDIAGMAKALGILTQTGGATSHAAVVARAMDKPCVVGCMQLKLAGDLGFEAKKVTIDGSTGNIWFNTDVPVIDNSNSPEVQAVMSWCLEKMGWVEATVVDLEEDRPHTIIAAHWWGDEGALEAILDSLIEKESRAGVMLDCAPPAHYMDDSDKTLLNAFGMDMPATELAFQIVLVSRLYEYSKSAKLAGLTLLNLACSPSQRSDLSKRGLHVAAKPKTVADLMSPIAVQPDKQFIDEIIGGADAWEKLQKVMQAAGYAKNGAARAVPPDYAVYRALGG